MRKSKPGFDSTSQTYADAKEIMGSPSPTPAAPSGGHGVHNIDITPADNGGVTVNHSMKKSPKKGNEWDTSGPRQTNVFGTPEDAHAHIGKLLGVKGHAPKTGMGGGGLT